MNQVKKVVVSVVTFSVICGCTVSIAMFTGRVLDTYLPVVHDESYCYNDYTVPFFNDRYEVYGHATKRTFVACPVDY